MRKVRIFSAFFEREYDKPQHQTELGHLGRLNMDRTQREPATRPAAGVPQPEHAHEQEDSHHREDRIGVPAVAVIVDVARDPHEHERDHDVKDLPLQIKLRVFHLNGRLDGAGAIDHDHAEADERDDDRREHGVDGAVFGAPPQERPRKERVHLFFPFAEGRFGESACTARTNASPRSL